jgi:hypothetical protein
MRLAAPPNKLSFKKLSEALVLTCVIENLRTQEMDELTKY